MRDMVHNIGPVQAIGPAVLAADTSSAAIGLAGFESAVLLLSVGAGGVTFTATDKIEFKVTHSDTANGTYDAVTQIDIVGATVGAGGTVLALTSAHASATIDKIGYVGNRGFIKVQADFSGTHGTGTPISVTLVKGHPRNAPVA